MSLNAQTPAYTNSFGYAIFTYPSLSRGAHNVTFVSVANGTYNFASASRPITAFLTTTVTLQAGTIVIGQQNTISLSLKDSSNSPLSGKLVRIELNGAFYQNITTDSNGRGQFTLRPDNAGILTIVARFSPAAAADYGYRASMNTISANIVPQIVTSTDSGSGGTQSVQYSTAQGQPVNMGLSVSIQFPSLGTVSVSITYNGQVFHGSLHIWNEFKHKMCCLVSRSMRVHRTNLERSL